MKNIYLSTLLLLLVSGLSAQQVRLLNAGKNAPQVDPTQIVGLSFDTLPPTIVCHTNQINNLSSVGTVTFTAEEFLQFLSDNETPISFIKIGIRIADTGAGFPLDEDGNPNSFVSFNCTNLGEHLVEIWAMDLAGNVTFCQGTITIKDDFSFCAGYNPIQICIQSSCSGEAMEGIETEILGWQGFLPPFLGYPTDPKTDENGCSTFYLPDSSTYIFAPQKDDEPLNGVDTYDLLLLSKHISGVAPLESPYNIIAGDSNKSGSLSTFDISELQKLILGTYNELPNNKSWRFIDTNFEFPNPNNPFASGFPESISMQNGPLSNGHFAGVKVGDLDCSASPNGLQPLPDYPDAELAMPDTLLVAGEVYDIPIFMTTNGSWAGYQFTLEFEASKIEYLSIEPHPSTTIANWNAQLASSGVLTTSWFQQDAPIGLGPNFPLATFRFRVLETIYLKNVLTLDNTRLHAEGYQGWDAEKRDLVLNFKDHFQRPDPSAPTAEKPQILIDPTIIVQQAPANKIAPQIICLNGLSVNIMPTGAITLWASDFLQSVTDNETPVDQIKIGLRKCGTGTGFPVDFGGNPISFIQFECLELGTQCIELWAEDADGNTNYCETNTVVLDNLENCNAGNWLIGICAKTEMTDGVEEFGVEEFDIEVIGTNPNEPFYANAVPDPSPFSGCGYFVVPFGSDVIAKPLKDDNPLNGVTSYDKVLISKHIEGVEPFNSPYKLIAADVDRNGLIDSMDILEIENLILGIYTEFPNNTSWRFVDKSYTFPDPNNPFLQAFPESIMVQNIQAAVSADFVGIKIGDVNNTAVANLLEPVIDERKTQKDGLDLQLERPSPNPTDQSARLSVTLPIAEDVQMVLSDATGRLCWTQNVQLDKGRHTLEIPATAMPTSGIYIWQIKVGGVVEAGKLLRL